MNKNYLSVFLFLLLFGSPVFSQSMDYDPDLWLPDTIYMALGNTIELYNDDIAFIRLNDMSLHFTWTHEKGMSDNKKFYWTANQTGNVKLKIKCFHINEPVDSATTILKVVKKINTDIKNLITIGNSLTALGYVYQFQQVLLDMDFEVNPVGTQGSPYKHEGHSGWMFSTYLGSGSPFFIQNEISIKKYVEDNDLQSPDIIRISLGINDCFGDSPMDDIVRNASILIDDIFNDYPNSLIIIALPPLSEGTGAGWIRDYGDLSNFEPYLLRMRELWKRLYAKYGYGKYDKNIQLSFDGLFIDRINGYPIDNGVHPNQTGYSQLIRSFSNTLNYLISKTVSPNTPVTISGVTAGNKIYDATKSAGLNTINSGLAGVSSGDDVTLLSAEAIGTFENKNAGSNKLVFTSGFTLTGADADKYVLIQPTARANISTRSLTIEGLFTAYSKIYDGNTAATIAVNQLSLSTKVGNDDVTLAPVAVFAGTAVGSGKTVSLTNSPLAGASAANYSLSFTGAPVAVANITAKPLVITANPGQSKVYGQSDPIFTFSSNPSLITGDNFSGALGRIQGGNVGTYAFTIGTISAGSNYTLSFGASPTFRITAKTIVITASSGQKKAYGEADPTFTFSNNPALLTGDSFSGALGRSAGVNAGSYAYTQGTLTAGSNYILSIAAPPTFSITPKELSVTGISAVSKFYDGNTTATLSGTTSLSGVLSPDEVILGGTPVARFVSANIGNFIPVFVAGYTLSGAKSGNYTLRQPEGLSANIMPVVTIIEETKDTDLCYSVYPNPANDFITLNIPNCDNVNVSYMLYSMWGILLENEKVTGNETMIPIQKLVSGTYFIKITSNNQEVKTIKIIKN